MNVKKEITKILHEHEQESPLDKKLAEARIIAIWDVRRAYHSLTTDAWRKKVEEGLAELIADYYEKYGEIPNWEGE